MRGGKRKKKGGRVDVCGLFVSVREFVFVRARVVNVLFIQTANLNATLEGFWRGNVWQNNRVVASDPFACLSLLSLSLSLSFVYFSFFSF